MFVRRRFEESRLVSCEWIHVRLGFVASAQVLAEPMSGVRDEDFIIDGLRENRTERSQHPANGGHLQSLGPTAEHQISAMRSTNVAET
jgi:hypothetical protein